ncbi:MAG: Y-family DNA polymerase [Muribaculaceae bacterium]|nr:Y-family DNA polymerase [Muribaculaceae bacterium]
MTGLADCNNFFVSCERSVDPSLCGKAVVVLSNNDGCVVARSNEAKRLGVRMGQPAFQLRDMIRDRHLIALSGNHLLYRDISLKVHAIFRRFVPDSIDYSVDESFLDLTGIPVDVIPDIGNAMVKACMDELSIPVTIGFAPTKTLAKVYAENAKKGGCPVAVCVNAADALPLLQRLPISDLWGIGRRLAKRLYQNGVYTAADFISRDAAWVRRLLGLQGERSWRELHGQPCIDLDHVLRPIQDSISESRTFPEDVDDPDYLRARIVIYASHCARRLRDMNGVCRSVGVFLRTNPFRPGLPVVRPEGITRLLHPTSLTTEIVEAALAQLDAIYPRGIPFKRAGVWLADITPDSAVAPSLFDEPSSRSAAMKFMKTIDAINDRSHRPAIRLASQIVNPSAHAAHNDGYSTSFQAPRPLGDEPMP